MSADERKGGTDVQFEAIVEEYGGYLRRLIARLCPADLGIEYGDVEQDARVRLWRAIEAGKEIADPASYIYRIAATTTIDAIRRVKARRERQFHAFEDQEGNDELLMLPAPIEASPDSIAARRQLRAKVRKAIDRLGDNRSKAVLMHLEGLTLDEVARVNGWSIPKARHHIYRGLSDLRRELRAEGIESATD